MTNNISSNVFVEILHFPTLATKTGKVIWCAMVPCYWALAFVVAGAVPNLGDLSSLVGGEFALPLPTLPYIPANIPSQHSALATS